MPSNKETLDALARYDTATICNVIELFDIRPRNVGFMDHRIQAAFPELPPMVGYALTAEFRSAELLPAGSVYASVAEQLKAAADLPSPPVIAFQDLDDPPVGATFGEVMCSIYSSIGAAGLITSGAGRDLPQVRELDFPVFQGSAICSHAYGQLVGVGRPVRIGGLLVNSGDLLHGDVNGVTNIPPEIAGEIPDVAEAFVAAEQKLIGAVKQTTTLSPAELNEYQQELVATLKKLQAEVSRGDKNSA